MHKLSSAYQQGNGMIPDIITTRRLSLQEMHVGHCNSLRKVFSNPDFFYAYALQNNKPTDQAALDYAQLAENTRLTVPRTSWIMSIFLNHSKVFIGSVVLVDVHHDDRYGFTGEIGYFIDVPFQRNGYASEAAHALVEAAAAYLNLECLWATVAPANVASILILESLGLSFECQDDSSRYFERDGSPSPRFLYRGTVRKPAVPLMA